MGLKTTRVNSMSGQWTHQGDLTFDEDGYSWDYKLDM